MYKSIQNIFLQTDITICYCEDIYFVITVCYRKSVKNKSLIDKTFFVFNYSFVVFYKKTNLLYLNSKFLRFWNFEILEFYSLKRMGTFKIYFEI